jgi:hypothetical protein
MILVAIIETLNFQSFPARRRSQFNESRTGCLESVCYGLPQTFAPRFEFLPSVDARVADLVVDQFASDMALDVGRRRDLSAGSFPELLPVVFLVLGHERTKGVVRWEGLPHEQGRRRFHRLITQLGTTVIARYNVRIMDVKCMTSSRENRDVTGRVR